MPIARLDRRPICMLRTYYHGFLAGCRGLLNAPLIKESTFLKGSNERKEAKTNSTWKGPTKYSQKVQQKRQQQTGKNIHSILPTYSFCFAVATRFARNLQKTICKRSMLKPDDVTLLHLRYVDLSYGACLRASTWWPDQFTCRNREGPDQVSSFFPVLVGKRCMARVSLMESAQKQEIERWRGRWAYRAEFNKVSHHLSSLFLVNDLFT